jgi:signal transduction histidine kinase
VGADLPHPASLEILHLEGDPRNTELMRETLRSDGLDCEVVRVDTRDQFQSLAVPEIIDQVVRLMRPLAAQRQIEIETVPITRDGVHVGADRQRPTQILLNLVSNAVKYNRFGGRVTVGCVDAGPGRVRITVTDTGAGIRSEKLALLFTPFERLGAAQTGIEGTGLGLALSRGLAEAMDGKLGVESEIDRGSTFWVELATADPVSEDVLGGRRACGRAGASRTVLYIEDNASNVRLWAPAESAGSRSSIPATDERPRDGRDARPN